MRKTLLRRNEHHSFTFVFTLSVLVVDLYRRKLTFSFQSFPVNRRRRRELRRGSWVPYYFISEWTSCVLVDFHPWMLFAMVIKKIMFVIIKHWRSILNIFEASGTNIKDTISREYSCSVVMNKTMLESCNFELNC